MHSVLAAINSWLSKDRRVWDRYDSTGVSQARELGSEGQTGPFCNYNTCMSYQIAWRSTHTPPPFSRWFLLIKRNDDYAM